MGGHPHRLVLHAVPHLPQCVHSALTLLHARWAADGVTPMPAHKRAHEHTNTYAPSPLQTRTHAQRTCC